MNKSAEELYQEYRKTLNELVNTYCQCRDSHPYDQYPELVKSIELVNDCIDIWRGVARSIAARKYYQGGNNV